MIVSAQSKEIADSIVRTISHDFKEPLRSIRWYSNKLLTQTSSTPPKRETLKKIQNFERLVTGIQDDFQKFYSEYRDSRIKLEEFRQFVSTKLGRRIRTLDAKWKALHPLVNSITFSDPIFGPDPEISIGNFNETVKRVVRRYDGLLQFLRLEKKTKPIQLGLHNEINRVLKDLISLRSERDFSYHCEGYLTGSFDQALVASIFQNLIVNSIKYKSPERDLAVNIFLGRIELSSIKDFIPRKLAAKVQQWRVKEAGVVIYQDNAIGMKPEYEESVFEPFVQIDPGAESSGSGMGLAIVRSAVERNGGVVWLKSHYGAGSIFYMLFPAESSVFRAPRDPDIDNKLRRTA